MNYILLLYEPIPRSLLTKLADVFRKEKTPTRRKVGSPFVKVNTSQELPHEGEIIPVWHPDSTTITNYQVFGVERPAIDIDPRQQTFATSRDGHPRVYAEKREDPFYFQ